MASHSTESLPAPAAQEAGLPAQVAHMRDEKSAALKDVGTATYQLQGSFDNVKWYDVGTALTADGFVDFESPFQFVRWNCTAYTSGTPTSIVCGHK